MTGKHWTEDELIYLEYFAFENDTELKEASKFLNRSVNAITKKLWQLRKNDDYNIAYMNRPWTEKEIVFIKKNYSQMSYKAIARRLKRGIASVEAIARANGLYKQKTMKDYDFEIRELASQGHFPAEISRELNLNAGSVRAYMIAQNIEYKSLTKNECLIRARQKSSWSKTNNVLFQD